MKKLLLALILTACGDNITAPPDAPSSRPDEVGDLDFGADPSSTGADAGVPDALPACEDKHAPKQAHKCQHARK